MQATVKNRMCASHSQVEDMCKPQPRRRHEQATAKEMTCASHCQGEDMCKSRSSIGHETTSTATLILSCIIPTISPVREMSMYLITEKYFGLFTIQTYIEGRVVGNH